MKKIALFICLFVTTLTYAQKVEFKASAPSVVEIGEQFRLSYSLNKEGRLKIDVLRVNGMVDGSEAPESRFSFID